MRDRLLEIAARGRHRTDHRRGPVVVLGEDLPALVEFGVRDRRLFRIEQGTVTRQAAHQHERKPGEQQALSAFTNCGFTTRESEEIARHPLRCRIASVIIVRGNTGLIATVGSFASSLSQPQPTRTIVNPIVIAFGVVLIVWIVRRPVVNRAVYRHARSRLARCYPLESWEADDLLRRERGYVLTRFVLSGTSPACAYAARASSQAEWRAAARGRRGAGHAAVSNRQACWYWWPNGCGLMTSNLLRFGHVVRLSGTSKQAPQPTAGVSLAWSRRALGVNLVMSDKAWEIEVGDGPLVASAIHDGHVLREEVATAFLLAEPSRLREEDPYTAVWTQVAPTRIVARQSRFEFDLNRPREAAVYREPKDAWGLALWKQSPQDAVVARSLQRYDEFYREVEDLFASKSAQHGKFVVFDLHSYNHRRDGPDGEPADPDANPEVNIGTRTMNREYWAPVVERFIADLRAFDFAGRHLDVRENVKFFGGNLGRWAHTKFPESACVLSIEFKKFFMDEWTGALDERQHLAIREALRSTVAGVSAELQKLGART